MLDITQQSVAESGMLHVKDAAGQPLYADAERKLPVRIKLFGPGSEAFAAIEAKQSARALKRMQDNDGKITPPTAEERSKETAEDLAAITIGFENFSYPPAGEAQGVALFQAVYADRKLGFVANQVTKFLADWGNFKPGSAGN